MTFARERGDRASLCERHSRGCWTCWVMYLSPQLASACSCE